MPPSSDTQRAATSLRNARRKYEALPNTAESRLRVDALYAWNDVAKDYFSKAADEFLEQNNLSANSGNPSYAEGVLKDLAEHHAAIGQAARQLGIDPRTLVPPFIKFTELQAYLHEKEPQIASALRNRFIEVGLPTYGFEDKTSQGLESRWFILGCVLLLFAVALVLWGFSLGTLTWDRQRLLVWALPLASGFSAAAFAGSIYTQARNWIPGIAITATGGFAVWLITFFFTRARASSQSSSEADRHWEVMATKSKQSFARKSSTVVSSLVGQDRTLTSSYTEVSIGLDIITTIITVNT
jgi:hypothetical protein